MMPLATFGNFFGPDMIIIFLVILLLFGAKKLPELARGLGQSLNEFRKAREDFEHELRADQQDPQAREAANRQAYNKPAAAALPYQPAAAPAQSAEALQQQVDQLQAQLREAKQKEVPATAGDVRTGV